MWNAWKQKAKFMEITGDCYVQAVLTYIYCLQLAPFLYSSDNWEWSSHIQCLKKINHCFLSSRNTIWFMSTFLSCSCLSFQTVCLLVQILFTEKKLQNFCFATYSLTWTISTTIFSVSFNFNQFWHSDCPVLGQVDYFILCDLEEIYCCFYASHIPDFLNFPLCYLYRFEHFNK